MNAARVLTVNAGSSSVKLRLIGSDDAILQEIEAPFDPVRGALGDVIHAVAGMDPADAIAHRVVHGGRVFREATVITRPVVDSLEELVPLAPLHQRSALALIDAVGKARPSTPAVACFDTAFHASMPAAASTYAVPVSWRAEHGVRRYGFHGLSHDFASQQGCAVLGRDRATTKVVVCHLGAGASVCAVADGRSVDTSMGFTPLEGLVMATRSGTIDPGALLWLIEGGLDPKHVRHALEHESGMLGLAGTPDMREITSRAASGDPTCSAALDVYVHRLRGAIASMAAAMDGVDVVVFTGGVGENSADVRERVGRGLAHLGLEVDRQRNAAATGDRDISSAAASTRVVVVAAREDLAMARAARRVLQG